MTINIAEIATKEVKRWLSHPIGHVNGNEVSVRVMHDMRASFHSHEETDEMFIVLNGVLYIDTDSDTITLKTGQSHTITSGIRHRTRAQARVELLSIIKRNDHGLV